MRSKAENNLLAAQRLINARTFPSESVHCSYYAVYQYMMYILNTTEKDPISYEEQQKLSNGSDSHTYTLLEITYRINKSSKEIRDFYNSVMELKNARITADYSTAQITETESLTYKSRAEGIISKLKQYFGNI